MVKKSSCLWFDKRILVLLIVCYVQNVTSFWEFAVCGDRNIELFDKNWKQLKKVDFSGIEVDGYKLEQIKSITFDVKNDIFYFINNQVPKDGIFKMQVVDGVPQQPKLLKKLNKSNARDIVYDSLKDTLYWSDLDMGKILKMQLTPKGEIETFYDAKSRDLEGMEIDSCNRNLLFLKKENQTINAVSLNDPKKIKSLRLSDTSKPLAIAMDHESRRIYIADQMKLKSDYSIDSVLSDFTDFRNEVADEHRVPFSISVDSESVYYIDGKEDELRSFSKNFNGGYRKSESKMIFKYAPKDIIVRSSFVNDLDSKFCQLKSEKVTTVRAASSTTNIPKSSSLPITISSTVETPTTAETCVCKKNCEIDLCNNFCLNDGKCLIVNNKPQCLCEGFAGDRCEINLCTNFCFHGKCTIDKLTSQPQCECEEDFTGVRCEKSSENISEILGNDHAEKFNDCLQSATNTTHIIVAACVLFSFIVFLAILLVLKKMRRPMQPRVRKTFRVHKSIEPLTYRPTTDHCEVVIEDCCNMNLCETPCYDPKTLQKEINESNLSVKLMPSKCSSKDDKQDLLKHMEYNQ